MDNYRDEFIKIAKEIADAMEKEDETPKVDYKEFNSQIEKEDRKSIPVYSGCISYFPDALKEIAKCSYEGQRQHNPDKPLGWDRSKSGDELDAMMRHLLDHASGIEFDECGTRHIVKCGWRILAYIQKEVEK